LSNALCAICFVLCEHKAPQERLAIWSDTIARMNAGSIFRPMQAFEMLWHMYRGKSTS